MADNWGGAVDDAADRSNEVWGPDLGRNQDWFAPPSYQNDPSMTIVRLKPMVDNQQPEHIRALAHQFDVAHQVLNDLARVVRAQSESLWNEGWNEGKARPEFFRRGPGTVLANLELWAARIIKNRDALHALVEPVHQSQEAMTKLWGEYQTAVARAGDMQFIGDFFNYYKVVEPWDFNPFNNEAEIKQFLSERVEATKKEYDQRARDIVNTVAQHYQKAFQDMVPGVGPAYTPPNVTMSNPGNRDPWWALGGLGGGLPPGFGGGRPPGAPSRPPGLPPGLNPQQLQRLQNGVPNPAPAAPGTPGGPPGLSPTNTPGTPPNAPPLTERSISATNVPGAPPGVGPLPPGLPAGLANPNLNGLTGARPGVVPNGFTSPVPPPGLGRGLARGVLRNPGSAPSFGMIPPGAGLRNRQAAREATLRSPGANYTSTGTPGMPPGGALGSRSGVMPPPGAARRRPTTPGVPVSRAGGVPGGVPEAFSRSSMPPPVAPVLGRQNRNRQGQRGSDAPGVPPFAVRRPFITPNAAPPVLDATMARGTGSTLPPPLGMPPQRSRRGRQDQGGVAGAGMPGVPGMPGMPMPGGQRRQAGDRQAGGPGAMPFMPGGVPPMGRRHGGRYTDRPTTNLVGNPNWLAETGPDELSSTAPVLRNQMAANPEVGTEPGTVLPTQPGATNPVLSRSREAVRRAMADNRTRPGAHTPAQAERELARRTRETDHHGRRADEAEARAGEEAFTVQTPGGSVVGGSGPARPEEAPRPTIGGST